jgi:hypothetical protein
MVNIGRPSNTIEIAEGVELAIAKKRAGYGTRKWSLAGDFEELEKARNLGTPEFDLAWGNPNNDIDNLSSGSGAKFVNILANPHSKTNLGGPITRRKSWSLSHVPGIVPGLRENGSNAKKNKPETRRPCNFSEKSEALDGISDSQGSGSENYDGFCGKELLNKNRDSLPKPKAKLASLDHRKNRLSILFNIAPVIEEAGCDSSRSIYQSITGTSPRGFEVGNKKKSEVDSILKKFHHLGGRLEYFDGFHLVDLEDIFKKVKIESEKLRKHINSIGKFFK